MLRKLWQNDRVSCGACAYVSVLDGLGIRISEKQGCDDCKTTKESGTSTINVFRALKKKNIECYLVNLNSIPFEQYKRFLHLNSINRLLYLSCYGSNKSKKGRPTNENHAICCASGYIYDSALKEILPIEAYAAMKYNYKFEIKEMILVEVPTEYRDRIKFDKGIDLEE